MCTQHWLGDSPESCSNRWGLQERRPYPPPGFFCQVCRESSEKRQGFAHHLWLCQVLPGCLDTPPQPWQWWCRQLAGKRWRLGAPRAAGCEGRAAALTAGGWCRAWPEGCTRRRLNLKARKEKKSTIWFNFLVFFFFFFLVFEKVFFLLFNLKTGSS